MYLLPKSNPKCNLSLDPVTLLSTLSTLKRFQVEEVQEIWSVRIDLERRSKDPSRLGNYKLLAQEEKDRKRVNTRLPKLEEKLKEAITKYELENGMPFLVGGVPFKDYWEGEVRLEAGEIVVTRRETTNALAGQRCIEEIIATW